MNRATIGVMLTAATVLAGRAVAQDLSSCKYFPKPNLIMVGGHEDHTRVIPVVLDYTTLDLTAGEACHAVTWSYATEEDGKREKRCFKIDDKSKNKEWEIKATFKNIRANGKHAGKVETAEKISAWKDRATAMVLVQQCNMQANRPLRDGKDGLDINYMRRVPTSVGPAPAA